MNPDHKNEAAPADLKEAQKEKPLTREQKRIVEKIESDAYRTMKMLSDKFFDFFLNSDNPEGPEVEAKRIQLSAQWKAYCFRKKLTKEAFGIFDTDAKATLAVYVASKQLTAEPPAPVEKQEPEPSTIQEEFGPGQDGVDIKTVSPAY